MKGILTSDIVDVFLAVLHTCDIVLKGNHLISRSWGVVAQQLRQLLSVLGILVDAKLKEE